MAGIRRITLNGNGLIGDEGVRILAETLKVSRQVIEERFSTIRPQKLQFRVYWPGESSFGSVKKMRWNMYRQKLEVNDSSLAESKTHSLELNCNSIIAIDYHSLIAALFHFN